jgi:hypothetical protein
MRPHLAYPAAFPDRVRFNWGFHDAQADTQYGRKPCVPPKDNPDRVYAAGYILGAAEFRLNSKRSASSDTAWLAYGEPDPDDVDPSV